MHIEQHYARSSKVDNQKRTISVVVYGRFTELNSQHDYIGHVVHVNDSETAPK